MKKIAIASVVFIIALVFYFLCSKPDKSDSSKTSLLTDTVADETNRNADSENSDDADIGSDSTDHFFNVGARGEFSPKLKGKFAIGLNTRKLDRGGDDTQLGVESSFSYEISPKTAFDFGVSNDFGTSPTGQQQKNFVLWGAINTKVTEEWSMNVGLSYRSIDYGRRTDDYLEGTLSAGYTVNANVKILGGYTYRNYSSDLAINEFKNNVFSVAANFRY